MAMFHVEAVLLLELALFAGGLVLLHFARQGGASLLRVAALVLLVGSVLTAACTVYYGIRYYVQGEFETAYPPHGMMGSGAGGVCSHGMMGPGPGGGHGGRHGMMHGRPPGAPPVEGTQPPARESPTEPAPPPTQEPGSD
jgi:hypothetical protein